MTSDSDFDPIRPFLDHEVPAAINRLMTEPVTYKLMHYLFPHLSKDQLIRRAKRVKTIRDLQMNFSHDAIKSILQNTSDGVSIDGIENMEKDKGCLFISNHRDILLDSAILNLVLVENGFETMETGTGDNLFISDVITDLMKLNRSYVIHRNLGRSEIYPYSIRLSRYIRQRVTQDQTSMWIAQRNGRTKNGLDQTETGLLKMLGLSEPDFYKAYASLRIIPVSVSYEYDPCDNLKARERYIQQVEGDYEKTKKDDLKSMLAGITDAKGKIHISLGKPLKDEFEELSKINPRNERYRKFVNLVDDQIYKGFKLWKPHYIGADMLAGTNSWENYYTSQEKETFSAYLDSRLSQYKEGKEETRKLMLEIYANPVKQKFSIIANSD